MERTVLRRVSTKQAKELRLRSRLKRKLIGELPVNERGEKVCPNCHQLPDFRGFELVHKIALSHGGKTNEENCVAWCSHCHGTTYHGIREV